MGLTDVQMALLFDIDERTLNRWKIRYPDFCLSIKKSKDLVDEKVKELLFIRATGMEITHKKIIEYSDGTTRKEMVVKHVPPSVPAIIFWLSTRRPDEWKRGGRNGEAQGDVKIVFDRPS